MPIDDGGAVKLGLRSSLGLAEQVAYATLVTPTRFAQFNTEGISEQHTRIESQALTANRFQTNWGAGGFGAEGPVSMELSPVAAQTLLWKHALGDVATSTPAGATDAREHVFTAADDITLQWLTAQVVMDGVPKTAVGCKIAQLQLTAAVDQIAMLQATLTGRNLDWAEPAAVPSYADPYPLFTFIHGNLQIAAADVAVNNVQLTVANSLATNRRRLGLGARRNANQNGFSDLTGTINADFLDLTLYNRAIAQSRAGAEALLSLEFESDLEVEAGFPYSLLLEANVRFDGTTPTAGGPEEIRQELQVKAFPSVDIPSGVRVTVVNDATAA